MCSLWFFPTSFHVAMVLILACKYNYRKTLIQENANVAAKLDRTNIGGKIFNRR